LAELEDLVEQIPDPDLRQAFVAALRDLKRRQRFGLVFEQHIPELGGLPGLPIQEGGLVHIKGGPDDGSLRRVLSITGDTVTLQPLEGGSSQDLSRSDLVTVKRFGEPVYSALTPLGGEKRGNHKPHHAVINGENFHVLQMMLYLYEGEVDCIYIDPPYNTGARDWKYNNHFVDENDSWRHSKWLAMMDKRLRLAKRLLKPNGVLICTVDEHEVHHLGMLLEELFPAHLRHMVTIVHNPKGTYKRNFARVDEYAIFCCPDTATEVINQLPEGLFAQAEKPEDLESALDEGYEDLYLRRRGIESGYRHQRPNQFYSILVDEEKQEVVGLGPLLAIDDAYEATRTGDVVTVYPLDTRNAERVWRYSRETMQELISKGEIVVSGFSARTGQGWVLNHRRPKRTTKRLKTVWWERRHDAGGHGSDLLTEYLGQSGLFPFPKSVYAVRDCLDAVVRNRPEALIVDFFAGSGTTLHAVCLLNLQDSGQRRCVLVTNNEVDPESGRKLTKAGFHQGDVEYEAQGLFEKVTRPRVEAVIKGVRPDGSPVQGEHVWAGRRPFSDGFEENVEFFRLDYLDPDEVDLGLQFKAILPALWLASGGVGNFWVGGEDDSMMIPEASTFAILFDEGKARDFAERLEGRSDITHIYVVTDSPEAYSEIRSLFGPGRHTSMLYRDYLRNFEINTVART
jgi:adenine-specific DNA-methyltransferase